MALVLLQGHADLTQSVPDRHDKHAREVA